MEQNTGLTINPADEREIPKPRRRNMVLNLTFGIVALIFAMASATFVSVMSLLGFSVIFTEKGLIPMAVCLISAFASAAPAIIFGVMSRKLGMVSALNKVAVALSIASSCAGMVIFMTLALAVIADNAGILI